MKRPTQAETNPFPYSDSNKRYYTYDYYLRQTYGGKCVKITLDAGFTCPNIDGTCGRGGCIYCSPRGSGDFAESAALPLAEQYRRQRMKIRSKWEDARCIPYLQAHTGTHAAPERLRQIYAELTELPDAVALHIATRADCLSEPVLAVLAETAACLPLTVELGLQSAHDKTAEAINRCHDFSTFCAGYRRLRAAAPSARIGIHLINGLPGESRQMMLETAAAVACLHPDEVKLHVLHVLRDTALCAAYKAGKYIPMTREEYVDTVVEQLEILPPDIVIGRITGDGAPDALVAPLWSRKKLAVTDAIDRALFLRRSYQGIREKEATDLLAHSNINV